MTNQQINKIIDTAIEVVVKTPQLLFLIIAARVSGELWVYVYFTFYTESRKNKKYLEGFVGKTGLGIMSFCPTFVILYLAIYGFKNFQYEDALSLVITSVVISMLIQMAVILVVARKGH